jgi:hypothetical protein
MMVSMMSRISVSGIAASDGVPDVLVSCLVERLLRFPYSLVCGCHFGAGHVASCAGCA